MPSPPTRWRSIIREAMFVVFASVGAYFLSSWLFQLFASSSLSEPFVAMNSPAGFVLPFASIALASGVVAGLVLSASERAHSVRIAVWAGALGCALQLAIAVVVGGLAWAASNYALIGAPAMALGLLLGALLGRTIWHA